MVKSRKKISRPLRKSVKLVEKSSYSNSGEGCQLSRRLQTNLCTLQDLLANCEDIIFRSFKFGPGEGLEAAVIFIDGMVDKGIINDSILGSLMLDSRMAQPNSDLSLAEVRGRLEKRNLSAGEVEEATTLDEVINAVLSGDTALLIDGAQAALIVGTRGWAARGITEPASENVIRGPREGFSESIRTNTTMLRRKIKNPDFKLIRKKIGVRTGTVVIIAYIAGLADAKLVEEVLNRLDRIKIDAVLESAYIEELIDDNPLSPFPTIARSERPDTVAAKLLEGRVAILVDGTPLVLTVPTLAIEFLISPEDYYTRPYYATFIRLLRIGGFLITLLLPALYVAVMTYHQEMLPTPLTITTFASNEPIPFPIIVETIVIGFLFEILREAGVRMPRPVGQAVSIVGTLIIGEAAIRAGILSAPIIIIGAITGIAVFILPDPDMAVALIPLRLVLVIFAGIAGIFGLSMVGLIILTHLASLRSFGVPYLAPLAPLMPGDLKDTLVRVPWWAMLNRPKAILWQTSRREIKGLRPKPSKEGTEEYQAVQEVDDEE